MIKTKYKNDLMTKRLTNIIDVKPYGYRSTKIMIIYKYQPKENP